jgi:uncharacterized lipoprotein NlpE involved in copper resistance
MKHIAIIASVLVLVGCHKKQEIYYTEAEKSQIVGLCNMAETSERAIRADWCVTTALKVLKNKREPIGPSLYNSAVKGEEIAGHILYPLKHED